MQFGRRTARINQRPAGPYPFSWPDIGFHLFQGRWFGTFHNRFPGVFPASCMLEPRVRWTYLECAVSSGWEMSPDVSITSTCRKSHESKSFAKAGIWEHYGFQISAFSYTSQNKGEKRYKMSQKCDQPSPLYWYNLLYSVGWCKLWCIVFPKGSRSSGSPCTFRKCSWRACWG